VTEFDDPMNAPRKPTSNQRIAVGVRNDAPRPAAAPGARKSYMPPTLVRWGSLLEMTQANGNQGNKDGGRKPYQRTR
jgi:hypothetical protein